MFLFCTCHGLRRAWQKLSTHVASSSYIRREPKSQLPALPWPRTRGLRSWSMKEGEIRIAAGQMYTHVHEYTAGHFEEACLLCPWQCVRTRTGHFVQMPSLYFHLFYHVTNFSEKPGRKLLSLCVFSHKTPAPLFNGHLGFLYEASLSVLQLMLDVPPSSAALI